MALFNKVYVIPHDIYLELRGDHEDIILKDESFSYTNLLETLDDKNYPTNFRKLLIYVKLFLLFPYIQYDPHNPYSFEEEFTMRIGQVYTLFDMYSQGNKYTLDFVYRQIEDLISLLGQEKLNIEFIDREEFDKICIKESEEQFVRPIRSIDRNDPDLQEIVVPVFHLFTEYQKSEATKIVGEPIEVIKEDINKFLLICELGIIDLLDSSWGWAGKFEKDGTIQSLWTNEAAFARLISTLFEFNNRTIMLQTQIPWIVLPWFFYKTVINLNKN